MPVRCFHGCLSMPQITAVKAKDEGQPVAICHADAKGAEEPRFTASIAALVRTRYTAAASAGFLMSLAIYRDANALFRYNVPVGVDGYYYAVQVRALLETGKLYYPSATPAVFYFLAFFCRLGSDTVFWIKVGSIVLQLLLFVGVFFLCVALTRSFWASVAGLAVGLFLPSRMFLLADFLKETLSLALLAWGTLLLLRARTSRAALAYVLSIASFLLALLAHKSAAILLVSFVLAALVLEAGRRYALVPGIVILGSWSLAAFAGATFARAFVGSGVVIPLRSAVFTWWTPEQLALLIIAPLSLALWARGETGSRIGSMITPCVALLGICVSANPLLDHSSDHVFGRATMTACLQLGLVTAGLLGARPTRKQVLALWPASVVGVCFLLIAAMSQPGAKGMDGEYLARRSLLHDALKQAIMNHNSATVIAPHGDEFAVTFETRAAAEQHWAATTSQVYWLLDGVPKGTFPAATTRVPSTPLEERVLLKDDALRIEWLACTYETRKLLLAENPELIPAGYSE